MFFGAGAHEFTGFGGGCFRWKFFHRRKAFRGEAELLLTLMKRIGRIGEFGEQEADGGALAAFHDFFAPEEDLANRVRVALNRELFVERTDEAGERVVNADEFLTFDNGEGGTRGGRGREKNCKEDSGRIRFGLRRSPSDRRRR